jgi:hypothetical protein
MPERGKQRAQQFFLGFRAERLAALAIDTNDLLMAGNDARLYRGDASRIGDNAFVRDVCRAKTLLQGATGFLSTDHPERFDLSSECGDVYGDISRATKAFTLLDEIHDGNRCFRRKPRGRPPKVAIEHQVSDDSDALSTQAGEPSFQPGKGLDNAGGHVVSLFFCYSIVYSAAIFDSSAIMTGISSRTG